MADPTTTNILLAVPLHGADTDSWDVPANGDFTSIDGFLAGVQAINAAGLAPITLTAPSGTPTPAGGPSQAQNAVLRFTGLLTGNVRVTLPLPGPMIIENLTTGSFVLSFQGVTATEVIAIEQGSCQRIYNDGANVRFVDLPPVGTYLDLCDATVPAWITACTKPPYLNCDGSTFSSVTYPYLNSKLGGTALPDFRGRAPFFLNQGSNRLTTAGAGIDGTTRFSGGGNNGVTLGVSQIPAGVPSSNAAPIALSTSTGGNNVNQGAPAAAGAGGGVQTVGQSFAPLTANGSLGIGSVPVTSTNATQTIVPSTIPGIVSGIRLIRAA